MEWTLEVTIHTKKAKGPEFCSQEPELAADPPAPGLWALTGLSGAELWLQQGPGGLAPAEPTAWRDFGLSQTERSDHGNLLSGHQVAAPLEGAVPRAELGFILDNMIMLMTGIIYWSFSLCWHCIKPLHLHVI